MSLTPAIIWTVTALTLGVIGGAFFLWAIFWDRARGRLRCPKCWYDMKGAVEAGPVPGEEGETRVSREPPWICPECGKSVAKIRRLKRTRRHKRLAAVALVSVLFLLHVPRLRHALTGQWERAIPSYALTLWPGALGHFEDWIDTPAGIETRKPSPLLKRIQDQTRGRLRYGGFNRLETWILTQRLRAFFRERGLVELTSADLDAVARAEFARIAMHDGEVSIGEIEAAASSIGLAFVDEREWKDRWWLRPELRRGSYDRPVHWGDGHTWDLARTALLARVMDNLAIEDTWGVTATRLQLANERDLDKRLHVYDAHGIIRRLVSSDRADSRHRRYWQTRPDLHWSKGDLVIEVCAFDSWMRNGGEAAKLFSFGDRLVVYAPPRVHAEVHELLAMVESALRTKRQTPGESLADLAALLELETRAVTDDEARLLTVGEAVRLIENRTGRRVNIRLDADRGSEVLSLSIDAPVPLTASALCDAIVASLIAKGVAAPTWTTDGDAIALGTFLPTTTRAYSLAHTRARMRTMAGDERMVWGKSLQLLIDRVTSEIEFEQWVDNGGEIASIHPIGDLVVVHGTPTIHARVTRLLEEIAREPPMPVVSPYEDDPGPYASPFGGTMGDVEDDY